MDEPTGGGILMARYSGEIEVNDVSGIYAELMLESVLQFRCHTCFHYNAKQSGYCGKHNVYGMNKFDRCPNHVLWEEVFIKFNPKKAKIELYSFAKNNKPVIHLESFPEKFYRIIGREKVLWLIDNYDKGIKLLDDGSYKERGLILDYDNDKGEQNEK